MKPILTKGTMPLELLRLDQCFMRLTEKQKLLIESYVASGGDKVGSVLAAYHVKDRETARKMSYDSFSRPAVVEVLNAYWGLTPFESFKRDVSRAVRNKRLSVAQIRALELQARVNGWGIVNLPHLNRYAPSETSQAAQSETKFRVGEICTQDGQRFRVTSIDADGHPLTADAVE